MSPTRRRATVALVLLSALEMSFGADERPAPADEKRPALDPASLEPTPLGAHGFARSGETHIHFVASPPHGEARDRPLVVLIHRFPDFWYTWRHQMPALAKGHQVVAIDQRGYNLSGQPADVESYSVDALTADVKAVVDHFQRDSAIIVGHDWGGLVAWSFAMRYPDATARLVVLNTPHPWGLRRELATNPRQRENSAYARSFQRPDAAARLNAAALAGWVEDPEARARYVEAFRRSSFEAMLNYYKANYPREPYAVPAEDPPKIRCPVLVIHGLKDPYLLAAGHDGTWRWVERDFTLVTVSDSSHFIQHEKPQLVTQTILQWLRADATPELPDASRSLDRDAPRSDP